VRLVIVLSGCVVAFRGLLRLESFEMGPIAPIELKILIESVMTVNDSAH
jgi:hypothetical protein